MARRSRESRPTARGETSRIATEAIVNRTARKSRTGTRSSRSWIRKNVEPQLAVIASRARVASRVTRDGDGSPGHARQPSRRGCRCARSGALVGAHGGDVALGVLVVAVLAARRRALVVGGDRVAVVRVQARRTRRVSTPASTLSWVSRSRSGRPAYHLIQRPVSGITCITPRAPAQETRRCCQPDSCQAIGEREPRGYVVAAGHPDDQVAHLRPGHVGVQPARVRGVCRCTTSGATVRARWCFGVVLPSCGAASSWGRGRAAAAARGGEHDRDAQRPGPGRAARRAEPVEAEQLGGPGVVAHRQPGRGVTGTDGVPHDRAVRVARPRGGLAAGACGESQRLSTAADGGRCGASGAASACGSDTGASVC